MRRSNTRTILPTLTAGVLSLGLAGTLMPSAVYAQRTTIEGQPVVPQSAPPAQETPVRTIPPSTEGSIVPPGCTLQCPPAATPAPASAPQTVPPAAAPIPTVRVPEVYDTLIITGDDFRAETTAREIAPGPYTMADRMEAGLGGQKIPSGDYRVELPSGEQFDMNVKTSGSVDIVPDQAILNYRDGKPSVILGRVLDRTAIPSTVPAPPAVAEGGTVAPARTPRSAPQIPGTDLTTGKTYSVDLDGDGKTDRLTFNTDKAHVLFGVGIQNDYAVDDVRARIFDNIDVPTEHEYNPTAFGRRNIAPETVALGEHGIGALEAIIDSNSAAKETRLENAVALGTVIRRMAKSNADGAYIAATFMTNEEAAKVKLNYDEATADAFKRAYANDRSFQGIANVLLGSAIIQTFFVTDYQPFTSPNPVWATMISDKAIAMDGEINSLTPNTPETTEKLLDMYKGVVREITYYLEAQKTTKEEIKQW